MFDVIGNELCDMLFQFFPKGNLKRLFNKQRMRMDNCHSNWFNHEQCFGV